MKIEEYCLINGDNPLSCERPKKIFTKENGIISVPCRKCRQCRKNIAAQWSNRLSNQLTTSHKAVFITLTYNDLFVEDISKREIQLFFKKFRKLFDTKLKYFACGEYGEKSGRPHYHVIIFGIDMKDLNTKRLNGINYCEKLEKTWNKGFYSIGNVNGKVINYVTGYLLKSKDGFRLMSKGLGKENTLQNSVSLIEMYKRGNVNLDRYQTNLLGLSFMELYENARRRREEEFKKFGVENEEQLRKFNRERREYLSILNQQKDALFNKGGKI